MYIFKPLQVNRKMLQKSEKVIQCTEFSAKLRCKNGEKKISCDDQPKVNITYGFKQSFL